MTEYLEREQVLEVLWCCIWANRDNVEGKKASALAYCEVRNLGYDTDYTLKDKLKEVKK